MAAFYIYVDDSGKYENPKNDYISLCGYVAHISEWTRFSQEWLNCIHVWQVPTIHMSPIMYPDRDRRWQEVKDKWGDNWEKKRDRMLGEFGQIILRNSMVCVGAVVDAKHYRAMPPSKFTENLTPLSFAFQHCVMKGIQTTEVIDDHSPVSIVIDDDRESSLHCYEMLDRLKQAFPKVRKRVDGICFVNDRSYPAIQAADMIAFEARRLMEARVKDPTAESSELFSSLTRWGIHQPALYTAEHLDKWERDSLAALKARDEEEKQS